MPKQTLGEYLTENITKASASLEQARQRGDESATEYWKGYIVALNAVQTAKREERIA